MFSIANQIAYNNKMVLPSDIEKVGKTGWLDSRGTSFQKQYVKEHGEKSIRIAS